MNKIRAAIVGYGNLGRSVEKLLAMQPDMELAGIFSRRDGLDTQAPVWAVDTFDQHLDGFDVALLCTGSATDIPKQAPGFAARACTVDTFDNHHEIPQHRAAMNEAARQAGTVAIISTGWDPGVFSVQRARGVDPAPLPADHLLGPGRLPRPLQCVAAYRRRQEGHPVHHPQRRRP